MNSKKEVQHVYLVGAKSLGAYGGYETFVYKLTEYHQNKENIKYHVACKANGDGCMDESKFDGVTKINDHEFEFHNAHCFKIDVPQIGPAQAIYYDVAALKACCEHIKKNHIPHPIVYIMACRIGPFASHFYREIHKLGGTVYLNPDGLAAVSSSFFAALCSAFGRYDVVHIHAEGPAFFCWIPKLFGKRVISTIHGLDWAREKWKFGVGSKFIRQGEKMP